MSEEKHNLLVSYIEQAMRCTNGSVPPEFGAANNGKNTKSKSVFWERIGSFISAKGINFKMRRQKIYNQNVADALITLNDMINGYENEIEELRTQVDAFLAEKKAAEFNIDYFAFENEFRGEENRVKEIQKQYISYFANATGTVIDIGCGRGEFLELLREAGVQHLGIDMYHPFVEYCQNKGLNVREGDALEVLASMPDESISGIMMSHVVEHLTPGYIVKLIDVAKVKLVEGGCFMMQTPNPQALFTYIDFYTDLTHIKPVHYRSLEFLFSQAGYTKIERYNPPETKFKEVMGPLYGGETQLNLTEFNYGVGNINEWLTGYQDYVIIAYK